MDVSSKTVVMINVCAAAEWDSEKVNVLPRYNPSLNKVIAAAQLAPAARQQDNNSVVRA